MPSPRRAKARPSGTVVSLCDPAAGRERLAIKGPMAESCGVAFSPDGRTLAVGTDRAITLHDTESGEERASLTSENHYGSLGLAFSSDGRTLVSATTMGHAVVWDVATKRELATLKVHTRSFCGVAVSPDGSMVASASDGPITCHPIGPFGLPPEIFGASAVGCGPDYGIVRLFDVASGEQRASLKHDRTAYSVAFSPDGKLLASGGGGAAKLWDLATNKARTLLEVEPDLDVYCVAFSPDGRTLAVGVGSRRFDGIEGEVRLWDVRQGRVRAVLKGEMGKVRSLAFSPDSKRLVTVSRRVVVLWDVGQDVLGSETRVVGTR